MLINHFWKATAKLTVHTHGATNNLLFQLIKAFISKYFAKDKSKIVN